MKSFYLALIFIVLNLFSFSAFATTYYVSPLGNDANSGTSINDPWQTIAKIDSTTFVGDTILFLGGNTFAGSMIFTDADTGTSVRPIVIGSYGGGKATISSDTLYAMYVNNAAGFKIKNLICQGSGISTNRQAGILFYMDKDSTSLLPYITLDSVEVYGYRFSGISIGSWNKKGGYRDISITHSLVHDNGLGGISIYAELSYVQKNVYIGYNQVYNNTGLSDKLDGNSGSGIVLGNADGAVIEYCTSYNNGINHVNPNGGPVGIWAYESNNVIMQFNESHHNKTGNIYDGGGFDLDGGCTNSIMQYNYSHDNYGPGFMVAQYLGAPTMKSNIVRYNISENDVRNKIAGVHAYGSIHIWGSTNSSTVIQKVEIYNNTVYLKPVVTGSPHRAFMYQNGGLSGVNVRNNIFQTTNGTTIVNLYKTTGIMFQGNDYWSSGSTFKITVGSTAYSSLTSWRTATGQEKLSGAATGKQIDPKFLDSVRGVTFSDPTKFPTLRTYKLQTSSGLINTGLNLKKKFGLNVGTRDFWGNSITPDTLYNIGAFDIGKKAVTSAVTLTTESTETQLSQLRLEAFPNPFSSDTKVNFSLSEPGIVNILLYNFEGKVVRSLFTGNLNSGQYKNLILNASGLANGAYIIRMISEKKVLMQKLIIKQ
jgi:hypothetical protein